MPDPITPTERLQILTAIEDYVHRLRLAADVPGLSRVDYDAQFVRESIADACHAIDAAVADVPTEEEITQR